MAPLEQRTVPAKVCKRCGLTKSASEFYRNKLMSDGLYSHCKVDVLDQPLTFSIGGSLRCQHQSHRLRGQKMPCMGSWSSVKQC